MSYIWKVSVPITTDSSGDSEDYSVIVNGFLSRVEFVKPGSDGFDAGVDFVITTDRDAQALLTVANVANSTVWAPRQAKHAVDGTASLYAGAGEPVESLIPIFHDRIKIVTDEGGNVLNVTLVFWIG